MTDIKISFITSIDQNEVSSILLPIVKGHDLCPYFNIIKLATDLVMKKIEKYTYITHPKHLPLELTGNSKKRSVQLKRQQFNGEKGSIDGDSRTLLAKKITNNIHDLNHLKSILPSQCDRKRSRPNSIKTFKQDNQATKSSGVQYLMHKTQNLKQTNHHQRAHISQYVPTDLKRPQKKHFQKENIEPISIKAEHTKTHKQTVDVRLANDIYSNPYRIQKEAGPAKKLEHANLFKKGFQLGLQDKKGRKVSDNKLIEMIGSEGMNRNQGGLKERRQDWRISNVNFY